MKPLNAIKQKVISVLCAASVMCSTLPVFAASGNATNYDEISDKAAIMQLFAEERVKQYLTAEFRISQTGVAQDQTNASLGDTPQIAIKANTTAKIVVKPDNISRYKSASISYAQKGGKMNIKLLSSSTADGAGEEIAVLEIGAANDYVTRNSEKVNLDTNKIGSNEYFIVEIIPTTDAWIDFVELFETEVVEPTPIPEDELPAITDEEVTIIKSVATGNAIEVVNAGTENGESVTSEWETRETSQQWKMVAGNEKGWYYIVNVNSSKGIGMLGGTTAEGVSPIQWEPNNSPDQFWRFIEVKKGENTYYKILNKNSKLYLTAGVKLITQEKYTGEDNQLWKVVKKEGVDFAYGEKYEANYSVSSVSLKAVSNVISYNIMHTQAEGMYLEITVTGPNGFTSIASGAKGEFNITEDGNYTVTATLYEDNTKAVLMSDPVSKTITVTNGGYEVEGADWICSTENNPWTEMGTIETEIADDTDIAAIKQGERDYIMVDPNTRYQEMSATPWGGCFNEMGWEYIMQLNPDFKPNMVYGENKVKSIHKVEGDDAKIDYNNLNNDQKEVIDLLYKPDYGLGFTAGRMSIGPSDFGLDFYSYDETAGDYELKNFDASRDLEHMIPYIDAANIAMGNNIAEGETMPIFGSPWTPPSWMKTNGRLNGKRAGTPNIKATIIDGKADAETAKMFTTYANYFIKYLEFYHEQGIDIKTLTPQNEPTMNTPYPSCVWNGEQLNVFLRDYLIPAVEAYNTKYEGLRDHVDVWLGTFTDANQSMVWPTFKDPVTSKKVDGYGFQWWSASLAENVYMSSKADNNATDDGSNVDENGDVERGKVNPVKLVQTETKCGGNENNWTYAEEQFDCFKQFLDVGISEYYLWNMVLDEYGSNNAQPDDMKWPQNAPIVIDLENHTYRLTPQFYQVKHFSANVGPYARKIKTEGNNLGDGEVSSHVQDVRAISFQNTDGEIVINVKNSTSENKDITIVVGNEKFDVSIPSHSINTFSLDGEYKNTPDATEVVARKASTDLKITSAAGDQLLMSADGTSGVNLTVEKGESYQTWRLVDKDDDDYYHFVNFYSDLGIDVWGNSKEAGADIKQYANTGGDNQKWRLEFVEYRGKSDNRKAYYKILNKNSGLVLSIRTDADPVPTNVEKTVLTQTVYTGTDEQLWTITDLTGTWEFPEDTEKPDDTTAKTTTQIIPSETSDYKLSTTLKDIPEGSMVIAASYKADNTLICVDTAVTTASNTVLTELKKENVSYIKIMVWDTLSGMKPITGGELVPIPTRE